MKVFCCEQEWEAMLTCIYEARMSHLGHNDLRLAFLPVEQYELFDEYIEVEDDPEKADKVISAISRKISPAFYSRLAYCAMAAENDVLDNIYRVMLLGFAYGPKCLEMRQYKDIIRNELIYKRYGNEVHHFREFIRFHEINQQMYIAHVSPKSKVVIPLGEYFSDRMPTEHFMIVDDVHREAIVHPKDSTCYLQILSEEELKRLEASESENDEFTDLWKIFFDTIAIKQRANARCQTNLFPKWMRVHAVEFT